MADPVLAARQRVDSLTVDGGRDRRRNLLLAMLDYLEPEGLQAIAQEISNCANDKALKDLATHYITSVFIPMKATGGKTPQPTPSPLASEQAEVQELDDCISSSQAHLSTRMVGRTCLMRDGYRCVASEAWSTKTPQHLLPADVYGKQDETATCHIIPLSLAQYGDSHEAHHDESRTWSSLGRMFPGLKTRIADRLEDINDPSNLFTAGETIHRTFGSFRIAFEPQPEEHVYLVRDWGQAFFVGLALPQNRIIRFIDHSNGKTSLPDPYLFRIHLIVSQILHASGLAEVLNEYFDDYYSNRGLASDGSTILPLWIGVS